MTLKNFFISQLEEEAATTRKMLQLVPEDEYGWKPHPKSMSLIRLATHLGELAEWVTMGLTINELDFAVVGHYVEPIANNAELLNYFEKNLAKATADLQNHPEEIYSELWTLRDGNYVILNTNRADIIRIAISQMIHHRAQLGVYLRLLNIPIPGSYGPSADEMEAMAGATA